MNVIGVGGWLVDFMVSMPTMTFEYVTPKAILDYVKEVQS